jgi:hypothetical protein
VKTTHRGNDAEHGEFMTPGGIGNEKFLSDRIEGDPDGCIKLVGVYTVGFAPSVDLSTM